jgi:tetratricopeptide (TPR) repeat protein
MDAPCLKTRVVLHPAPESKRNKPMRVLHIRESALRTLLTMAVGLGGLLPAYAVDTLSKPEAPDLTAVRAKIKAKEFAAARDDLFKIANTNEHADVFNLLGFSLRKSGDYKNALTYYKKALDYDANHKGAHEYLGELYIETNQIAKAREHLAILVKLCPQGCEEREDLEKALAASNVKTN